jgi:hypothetical protein
MGNAKFARIVRSIEIGLTSDKDKRQTILKVSFGLHNFVVRRVGINQTGQVYNQEWKAGPMVGKDHVAAYYRL